MAIVCAIFDASTKKFLLGCNSGRLVGDAIVPEHRTKWMRFTNWAIALSGLGVAGDVLEQERAKFPNTTSDVNQVMAFIRAAFGKFDIGEMSERSKDYDVSGLIAHTSGALYHFDPRLALARIPEGAMWACGSGMEFALGADMAMKSKGHSPQERIEMAVLAAIDFDSGCPGEPMVEKFG